MTAAFSAGTMSASASRLRTRMALRPSASRRIWMILSASALRSGGLCQVTASPGSAGSFGVVAEAVVEREEQVARRLGRAEGAHGALRELGEVGLAALGEDDLELRHREGKHADDRI